MQTSILRWGNSKGIRLPKHLLDSANMTDTELVEVVAEINRIVIKKAVANAHKTTKERLKGFTGTYVFEEWDTGAPLGSEVINDEYVCGSRTEISRCHL